MKRATHIFIIAIILALPVSNLRAQQTMSMLEAVQRGLDQNFQVLISTKQAEIAAINNKWGEAGALPTIDLRLSQNNNVAQDNSPTSFIQGSYITNNATGVVDVNWVVFKGFEIKMTKRKLEMLQEQSEGNAALIVQNTIQSIILAYYDVVVQQKRLEIFGKVKKLSRDQYYLNKHKRELGSITTFDLLQIQGNYLTDSTNYVNQELAVKNALRNMNLLMAAPINDVYILSDTILPEIKVFNYDVLKDEMFSNNQNLIVLYINQNILHNDVALQKSGLWPVFSVGVGGNANYRHFQTEDRKVDGNSLNYYANFTLSYRLYNGGKVRRSIERAVQSEEIGNLNIEEMKLALEKDLAVAYDNYNSRIVILGITRESVATQKLNMQLAEEKFRNGTLNSFNYRDVQLRYILASLDELQAAYNLIQSHTELIRLTGGILSIANP